MKQLRTILRGGFRFLILILILIRTNRIFDHEMWRRLKLGLGLGLRLGGEPKKAKCAPRRPRRDNVIVLRAEWWHGLGVIAENPK